LRGQEREVVHELYRLETLLSRPADLHQLPNHRSVAMRPPSSIVLACAVAALSLLLVSCGAARRSSTTEAVPHAGFAVFDGAPTPADALPSEVVAWLEKSSQPEFDEAGIRASRRVLAGYPGWLVPAANGEMCLVRLIYPLIAAVHGTALPPTPSQTCAPQASAEAGRLVESQSLATSGTRSVQNRVLGVAPNGVAKVTIISSRGRRVTVEVIRNAYETVVEDPLAVEFVTTSHHKSVTHTIPLTSFNGRNVSPQPGTGASIR
jgi:hypothetical protein